MNAQCTRQCYILEFDIGIQNGQTNRQTNKQANVKTAISLSSYREVTRNLSIKLMILA